MNLDNVISAFLLGNDFSYITMKTAISFAEKGLKVWCISLEPLKKIPNNIPRPEKEILQLITFIYRKNWQDLIKHLNGTQNWNHINLPDIIILSQFETYCNLYENSTTSYNPLVTAYTCAMLLDSAATCAIKKHTSAGKCYIIVTCLENRAEFSSCDGSRNECRNRLQVVKDMYFEKLLYRSNFGNDELFVKEILDNYFLR